MFNLEILDKLIAVVVVLLVLSLVVQSVQMAIKKFFRIKSLQIEQSLIHLFYYAFDKDTLETMQTAAGRLPTLRNFLAKRDLAAVLPDEEVRALYRAVADEFRRAGRTTPATKLLIESVSKEDLLKFLGHVRVDALINHDPDHDPAALASLNQKIVEAREKLDQLTRNHRELIDKTPLAELEMPLRHLLTNANQFLSAGSSSFTLEELAKFGVAEIAEARRLLTGLPKPVKESIEQLEANAQGVAANQLRELQTALEPLHTQFDQVVSLPHKLSRIRGKIDEWYDTIMQSFEERYVRSMKTWAIAISVVVVVVLNANLFSIYREISNNESRRNLIVSMGSDIQEKVRQRQANTSEAVNQTVEEWKNESLARVKQDVSLYTALGFEGPKWLAHPRQAFRGAGVSGVIETIVGWLLMTMLLSVGAPFWQDTLESLFGLKNLLRKRSQQTEPSS